MLTALLFSLAPVVQSGADFHSPDAQVFIEIPDIQGFAKAWGTTALPSFYRDEALQEVLHLFEVPNLESLDTWLAGVPPQVGETVLPYIQGASSLSLSVTIDEERSAATLLEGVMAIQSMSALDELYMQVLMANGFSDALPVDIASLDIEPEELLDLYGNPYVFTMAEFGADLNITALGSDGKVGGEGSAADWDLGESQDDYLRTLLFSVVRFHLVAEWNDGALASETNAEILGGFELASEQMLNSEFSFIDQGVGFCRVAPKDLSLDRNSYPITVGIACGRRSTEVLIGARADEFLEGRLEGRSSLGQSEAFVGAIDSVHQSSTAAFSRGYLRQLKTDSTVSQTGTIPATVVGLLNLFAWKSGAWETSLADGRYVTSSFRETTAAPGNLNKVTRWVPNDAIFINASTFDAPGAWQALRSLLNGSQGADFDELEKVIGFDLSKELFANLGSEYAIWSNPIGGLAPPMVFGVVSVVDGTSVMAALDRLVDFAAETSADVKVRRRTYKKVDITTIDVGVPLGFTPNFAVMDGLLWMSNSPQQLRRFIRAKSKGDMGERGAHPALAGHLDQAGSLSTSVVCITHVDFGSLLASYYTVGKTFSAMIPADINLPEGLIEGLPDSGIFTRHLSPLNSATVQDGGRLITTMKSSVFAEPFALVAGLAGVVVPRVMDKVNSSNAAEFIVHDEDDFKASEASEPVMREAADTETTNTRRALEAVDLGLAIYLLDYDLFPAGLTSLLDAPGEMEMEYLQGATEVPKDGWGRDLHYAAAEDGSYELYSLGANGVDDGGAGDDVRP